MNLKRKIKDRLYKRYFSEYAIQKKVFPNNYGDFSNFEKEVVEKVKSHTMTNPERIVSLIRAVEYIEKNDIEGSVVECGVWKGGSMMAALLALKNKNNTNREAYLFDTYEGMSEPKDYDQSYRNESAIEAYKAKSEYWNRIKCLSNIEEVHFNVASTEYPAQNIHFVKGKVEDTIPDVLPNKIAILRLDTDWYESTLHELQHLYPKLVEGGVLIIDDYGHWQGCRKAVDEYFEAHNIKMYLSRIDYTCRIGIKIN
jgi:hypothetical protein